MVSARLILDPHFSVGPLNRRIFGSFVEHLGRCVYDGIYEPTHPTADGTGFRQDVVELVRELGVPFIRYPGGNFVSGYAWEDGVGPRERRPRRLDLAWHSTETNQVGLHEFAGWLERIGSELMLAVNLGTRGVQEALDLLEYSNIASGTAWSDLRRTHGTEAPHGIRMWCLGNEMDGPWQTGHKTPQEYGRLAAETGRAMRQLDPDLELVACGSSSSAMPTFGEWERVVLTEAYEQVDLISAHAYYWEEDGDLASFLGSAINMDHFIEDVVATADAVRAAGRHAKRIHLSFDEWNVWYLDGAASKPPTDSWPVAPVLLEDNYSVADAVVVGNLLISLLRHSDRVHAASLAQLVNVIAPIMTEPGGRVWKQTTFHPFALTARHAVGEVLRVEVDSPSHPTAKHGDTPLVDAVATYDDASGALAVFAGNRSLTQSVPVEIDVRALDGVRLVEAVSLAHDDPYARSSVEDDTTLVPRTNASATIEGNRVRVELPPVSWSMVRLGR